MAFETEAEKINKGMLNAYQLIARERWRHTTRPTTNGEIKSSVIVPSALVIGISHGQESRIQPYELHVAKEINYRFLKPVHLGDAIRTRIRITRLENNPDREYGYAWVRREIINQHNEVVYRANAKLLIKK
ncbi:MAG: hypothetical protein IPJ89_00525 [Candidatus Iainarchaeum archaeon]|uniref:MaoC family dehydratase n=1 Tax=Candidatus Iainarchaeum sp. TaxID=3101447 RepID=A0A7T9DJX7_9ARCH|nr:MAG: hypothetical protein IPJ89_00525 [Candidatus Diapherotrites archaeon]